MPTDGGEQELRPAFPGAKGFLVLAKLRAMRNVTREAFKRLKAFVPEYCQARGIPMPIVEEPKTEEEKVNGQEEAATEQKEEDAAALLESAYDSVIKFGPHEIMYDNCSFIVCSVEDPSDYAHFAFGKMADDPNWPQPRFPLRVMPVEEICCLQAKAVEVAVRPLIEKVFGGEESIRFSIIFHGKQYQDSKDLPRHQIEAIVRNIIWAVNPNCVQCIKYQDYAVLLEIVEPLLFVGIAKDFNQLGRYNTSTVKNGRDLKDKTEEDSEDEISDDPELSEADNIKKKLRIKKKRRAEKAEIEKSKQVKIDGSEVTTEDNGDGDENENEDEEAQEENGAEEEDVEDENE